MCLLKLLKRQPKETCAIQCTISTPQFMGNQDDFWMKKQTGSFNIETFLFTPDANPENDKGEVGKHSVQFESMENFKQFRIK